MFDPFDEKHRLKVKRRRPEEVAFEKQQWQDRVDNHFKRALDELGWPEYTDTETMLNLIGYNPETNVGMMLLRIGFERSMTRVGYIKMRNEKAKDGRWQFGKTFVFVYAKEGAPKIGKSQLKQELER